LSSPGKGEKPRSRTQKMSPKIEEAGHRSQEWKDFLKPAARWTLDRV
jgi:hypothetical protein